MIINLVNAILMAFIGIGFFGFMLLLFDSVRTRRLRKKYNEYNDLSKQGEIRRNKGASEFGRISAVTDREHLFEFERGKFLPTAITNQAGDNKSVVNESSSSTGKTSPSSRNFFNKLRRNKTVI